MKTNYSSHLYQNVSDNERAFRGLSGIAMLTAVIAGVVASPMTIFGILIAVYLIMTAALGSDPIYAAVHAITVDMSINRALHE